MLAVPWVHADTRAQPPAPTPGHRGDVMGESDRRRTTARLGAPQGLPPPHPPLTHAPPRGPFPPSCCGLWPSEADFTTGYGSQARIWKAPAPLLSCFTEKAEAQGGMPVCQGRTGLWTGQGPGPGPRPLPSSPGCPGRPWALPGPPGAHAPSHWGRGGSRPLHVPVWMQFGGVGRATHSLPLRALPPCPTGGPAAPTWRSTERRPPLGRALLLAPSGTPLWLGVWTAGWPGPRHREEGQGEPGRATGPVVRHPQSWGQRGHRRVPTRRRPSSHRQAGPQGEPVGWGGGRGARSPPPSYLLTTSYRFGKMVLRLRKQRLPAAPGVTDSRRPRVKRPATNFPTPKSHTPAAHRPLREQRDPSSHLGCPTWPRTHGARSRRPGHSPSIPTV